MMKKKNTTTTLDSTKTQLTAEELDAWETYAIRTERQKELEALIEFDKELLKQDIIPIIQNTFHKMHTKNITINNHSDINPCSIRLQTKIQKPAYSDEFLAEVWKTLQEKHATKTFSDLPYSEFEKAVMEVKERQAYQTSYLVHSWARIPVKDRNGKVHKFYRTRSDADMEKILNEMYNTFHFPKIDYNNRNMTDEEEAYRQQKEQEKKASKKRRSETKSSESAKSKKMKLIDQSNNTSTSNTSSSSHMQLAQ